MTPTITVNYDRFTQVMARLYALGEEYGKGGDVVIEPQAKLLVKELLAYTPPMRGQAAKGAEEPASPTAQSAGLSAVKRDFQRAVLVLGGHEIKNPELRRAFARAMESQNLEAMQNIARIYFGGNKKMRGADVELAANPFSDSPRELHERARNIKGRVQGNRKPKLILGSGQWHAWKAELKRLQEQVGALKAAWLPAAQRLGLKLPGYVTKHASYSPPVQDKLKNRGEPSLTITATGKGLDTEMGHYVNRALVGRMKAMEGHYRYLLRKIAKEGHL